MNRNSFFFTLLGLFLTGSRLTGSLLAQTNTAQRPSPPAQVTETVKGKTITIDYGQPSVKGRTIWGELVPYGKVWRAGANETTAFTLSADATVAGKPLGAGKYAFFVIPAEKQWTIIFNKTIKWGAFTYKQDEDVLRVDVPVKSTQIPVERLTYAISPKGDVTLSWADKQATFRVK